MILLLWNRRKIRKKGSELKKSVGQCQMFQSLHVMEVPGKEKGTGKKKFKEIMAENFPDLMKNLGTQKSQ